MFFLDSGRDHEYFLFDIIDFITSFHSELDLFSHLFGDEQVGEFFTFDNIEKIVFG